MLRESAGYQWILDEGREEGERKGRLTLLLKLGRKHFGQSAEAEAALKAITDVSRLDHLADTLDQAKTWDEWLQS